MSDSFEELSFPFDFSSSSSLHFQNDENEAPPEDNTNAPQLESSSIGQSPPSPLSFLLKTKSLITNYALISSRVLSQTTQTPPKEVPGQDFLEFSSDEEDISFSSSDYINLVSKDTCQNIQRGKKFARNSDLKLVFDFRKQDNRRKMEFMNCALRKMFNKLVVLNAGRDGSKNIKKIKVFACKVCNKKFDDGRKLGGHASKFHKKNRTC